ncbi:MAG: hypothetical protein HYU74_09960 [Dechloromonas sp.]|nr:hypothetical protein [Dechloromonas sp.]
MDRLWALRPELRKSLLMVVVGLCILFADGSGNQGFLGRLVQSVIAEGEDGQPGIDGYRTVNVVLVDHGSPACEAAKRHAIEIAPELLALANWPLDETPPAACMTGGRQETLATVDDAPLEVVAIPEQAAIVGVTASLPDNLLKAQEHSARLPEDDRQALLGQQLAALDATSLDEVRGGFELAGSGLKFTFGIERAVYINGELIASTVLNLRDLQLASATGIPSNIPGAASVQDVIQNGSGNNAPKQLSPNMVGTIIQNTLNDQKIQNVTTINATVNSMQALRSMSMHSAIQQGIVGSLRR